VVSKKIELFHTGIAREKLTRRQLLKRGTAFGATFVIGQGFISASNAAWAKTVDTLKPETFATLVQMARDIYPHDKIGDEFYVIAVKGYDNPDTAEGVTEGIGLLNATATKHGYDNYLSVGWERDRVAILRDIESEPFFQQVRGGLVTGLYNQKAVWPVFGYEGESFSKGGYLDHGFNDINWL